MITPFRSARLRSVNRPALLALTGAGLFLASLDAYVVVTALLPMLTSVHIAVNRPEQATPIITGFLLGYLAVMPIAGGLSDRFGRIRVFAACLALFAICTRLATAARCWVQSVLSRRSAASWGRSGAVS
ncbi:MAG: multidrug efflux MFS transporter [Chloroflexi bacterium]|nr:MAG: multidrug efflux MFS transporter [Chloroflexota bacterium]